MEERREGCNHDQGSWSHEQPQQAGRASPELLEGVRPCRHPLSGCGLPAPEAVRFCRVKPPVFGHVTAAWGSNGRIHGGQRISFPDPRHCHPTQHRQPFHSAHPRPSSRSLLMGNERWLLRHSLGVGTVLCRKQVFFFPPYKLESPEKKTERTPFVHGAQ